MPKNESFEELTGKAAKLIYLILDSVEDDTATKAGLESALNELAMMMFLITRTPEEMKLINEGRKIVNACLESNHVKH